MRSAQGVIAHSRAALLRCSARRSASAGSASSIGTKMWSWWVFADQRYWVERAEIGACWRDGVDVDAGVQGWLHLSEETSQFGVGVGAVHVAGG
jgi:hypothetical protein